VCGMEREGGTGRTKNFRMIKEGTRYALFLEAYWELVRQEKDGSMEEGKDRVEEAKIVQLPMKVNGHEVGNIGRRDE
jgi:hypothetical protein